jgi:hypothetical protein
MPLAGTLQDLSISSLIQIFCLERKQTSLTVIRPNEVGVIYFVQGQVCHASAAGLEGPDAVTYLLSWHDGEFHTSDFGDDLPHTIQQRWDQLLLEGMKQLDERESPPPTAPATPLTAEERAREEALEETILRLFSRLELALRRLSSERVRRQPPFVLKELAGIANQTLKVFTDTLAGIPQTDAAQHAVHEMMANYLAQLPLDHTGRALDPARLLNDFQVASIWQPDAFVRFQQKLVKVVEYANFALIAVCFRAEDIKAELAETHSIFLADLRQRLALIET